MLASRSTKVVTALGYSTILAAICWTSLASAREIQTHNIQNTGKPGIQTTKPGVLPATTSGKPNIQTNNQTNNLTDQLAQPVDPADALCAELNVAIIAEGREPIPCNVQDPFGNQGANYYPQEDPEPSPVTQESEDVLLIHGFSSSSGHNCNEYWQAQKEKIEDTGRNAIILGWYEHNTGCGDYNLGGMNNQTPVEDVAEKLRDWIVENYAANGLSIDIVAHSLGGIVVRKMLDDWGQDLLVSDVVTLGTPHDGVKAAIMTSVCWYFYQCVQSAAGSDFMDTLKNNPQSAIPTQWTLIAASNDQTVGFGTGTNMSDGNNGGPVVNRYRYRWNHKQGCSLLTAAVGHGDLHGENGIKKVYNCNNFGQIMGSVERPTTRMLKAID